MSLHADTTKLIAMTIGKKSNICIFKKNLREFSQIIKIQLNIEWKKVPN